MPEAEAEEQLISKTKNSNRHFLRWCLILFSVFSLLLVGSVFFVLSERDLYHPMKIAYSLELIKAFYPESYDSHKMITLAREALLNQLDRYSSYLEPRELERIYEEFGGAYGGIGITITGHDCGLMIMSIREDGPADRAGMMTGDIILKADSTELAGIDPYRASYLLRGPEETKIDLSITRNRMTDTLELTVTREKLVLIHIPYAGLTENKSLYIRILDFEAGISRDLEAVLDSLYLHGKDTVKSIILDLRGNPGGLLNEAYQTADIFLDKSKLIVGVKSRSRWNDRSLYSTGDDITNNIPLAIIVNRGSASAAEILAGALRYAGRAILIGDTTFGKGLVQEYAGFGDGSGLRLTTSRYYFEGGIFLNDPEAEIIDSATGIPPDYYIKSIAEESFPAQLESSMLLRKFAIENAEEIVRYSPFTNAPAICFEKFIVYAKKDGFTYESETTRAAEMARIIVNDNSHSDATLMSIIRICGIAKNDDRMQFKKYKDYIEKRLYQIAMETVFDLASAYRDVILPGRPDIMVAEEIFQKEAAN